MKENVDFFVYSVKVQRSRVETRLNGCAAPMAWMIDKNDASGTNSLGQNIDQRPDEAATTPFARESAQAKDPSRLYLFCSGCLSGHRMSRVATNPGMRRLLIPNDQRQADRKLQKLGGLMRFPRQSPITL